MLAAASRRLDRAGRAAGAAPAWLAGGRAPAGRRGRAAPEFLHAAGRTQPRSNPMTWQFAQVERVEGLTPERFHRDYVTHRKPVILGKLAGSWPAIARWTPDYFQRSFPGLRVGV